jgi:formylglycine-generating enzyme
MSVRHERIRLSSAGMGGFLSVCSETAGPYTGRSSDGSRLPIAAPCQAFTRHADDVMIAKIKAALCSRNAVLHTTRPAAILGGMMAGHLVLRCLLAAVILAVTFGFSAAQTPVGSDKIIRDCSTCPEMMLIPAGSFMMGVPPEDDERQDVPKEVRPFNKPQHLVTFEGSFYLGRYPVTRSEFAAFVSATHFNPRGGCYGVFASVKKLNWRNPGFQQTDRDPVVCVSFTDAEAYIEWLNLKTGFIYRLPSEAEWEYAARAGTTTAWFWGDDPAMACQYANLLDRSLVAEIHHVYAPAVVPCSDGFTRTAPVGSFRPNAFGLYDMLGNASQWTSDCWNLTYVGAPTNGSAWEDGDCSWSSSRGGDWNTFLWNSRTGVRHANRIENRINTTGFRLARNGSAN